MYNNNEDGTYELWAVMKDGKILYSRGGSSSTPKIMVYRTEKKAEQALKNTWIKQIMNRESVIVRCIYKYNDVGCEK